MLPSATNSRNSYFNSAPPPPPPVISTWRGSDYIFGGFVDKPEIKVSQAENTAGINLILRFLKFFKNSLHSYIHFEINIKANS